MGVTFFENQPFYPKNGIQGETLPPPTCQQELIDFQLLDLEPSSMLHSTPSKHNELEPHK